MHHLFKKPNKDYLHWTLKMYNYWQRNPFHAFLRTVSLKSQDCHKNSKIQTPMPTFLYLTTYSFKRKWNKISFKIKILKYPVVLIKNTTTGPHPLFKTLEEIYISECLRFQKDSTVSLPLQALEGLKQHQ